MLKVLYQWLQIELGIQLCQLPIKTEESSPVLAGCQVQCIGKTDSPMVPGQGFPHERFLLEMHLFNGQEAFKG